MSLELALGIAGTIILLLLGIIGWLVRADRSSLSTQIRDARHDAHDNIVQVKDQVNKLQQEMQLLKESLPIRFIDRQQWLEFKDDIKAMREMMEDQMSQMRNFISTGLSRIESRLNQKQDKP